MKRLVLAGIKQETAVFNPVFTRYESFDVVLGDDIFKRYEDTETEPAGVLDVCRPNADLKVLPAYYAASVPGGPVPEPDLNRLVDDLVRAVAAAGEPDGAVDGVLLVLHGAMAGTDESDPEGLILTRVRDAVGSVPIVASMDLHAVLTDRMLETADVLVPFHTYPHTDHRETGRRAARALIRLVSDAPTVCTERIRLPMLVRGDELLTETGLFGTAMQTCREAEDIADVLAAGVVIGNPFTDVPELRSNVIVSAADARDRIRGIAERLAGFMWDNRQRFTHELTGLQDAVRQAGENPGLTVLSDAADATSSGASGDGNAILRGLVELGYQKRSLVPIVDAPAVDAAFRAGTGASLRVSLGGTLDPGRHRPLSLDVEVVRLSDHSFTYDDGTREPPVRTAELRAGTHTIFASERPLWFVGLRVFREHGIDPAEYDLVVLKSPNGFRTYYGSMASRIFCVDVPGSTSPNLRSLPYRRCPRPMYPLDADVVFDPRCAARRAWGRKAPESGRSADQ